MKVILLVICIQLAVITWKLCEISTDLYYFKATTRIYLEKIAKNTKNISVNVTIDKEDESEAADD